MKYAAPPTDSQGSKDGVPDISASMNNLPTGQMNQPATSGLHSDPTEDLNVQVGGWPLLAKVMVEAFPAFSDLNMKSLLYYQS